MIEILLALNLLLLTALLGVAILRPTHSCHCAPSDQAPAFKVKAADIQEPGLYRPSEDDLEEAEVRRGVIREVATRSP